MRAKEGGRGTRVGQVQPVPNGSVRRWGRVTGARSRRETRADPTVVYSSISQRVRVRQDAAGLDALSAAEPVNPPPQQQRAL